ncbi:MAG: hypothetical protein ACXV2A_04390, partial [Halobacteriota archaeon]
LFALIRGKILLETFSKFMRSCLDDLLLPALSRSFEMRDPYRRRHHLVILSLVLRTCAIL